MASPDNFNFPYFSPPPPPPSIKPPPSHPPPYPFTPPPPHLRPPLPPPLPPQPPPSPSPDNHTTLIVIVFVSFGGIFFLAFLEVALCCFIKKKREKIVQETDVVHVDEHLKVKEAIVPGPHGPRAVVLSIEDDVHIDEEIKKNEKFGEGLHGKESAPSSLEAGTSSGIEHHQLEHRA